VSAPRRLAQGEWSAAYAFSRGAEPLIARFSAYRDDFEKDRFAADRFASPALPIPRVLETGEAFDGFYAISEAAPGRHIDDVSGPELRALLPALFAALDAARTASLEGTCGYGVWGAAGNARHPTWRAALLDVAADGPGRRTSGWRERLAASPAGIRPFERAYARLEALTRDVAVGRHLVHSDLLHFNVLVANTRITAVLDWGSSLYGDFLYDLAWFRFFAPWFPAAREVDVTEEVLSHWRAVGLAVPDLERRMECCLLHIGLDAQAYCAFAGRPAAEIVQMAARTSEVTAV